MRSSCFVRPQTHKTSEPKFSLTRVWLPAYNNKKRSYFKDLEMKPKLKPPPVPDYMVSTNPGLEAQRRATPPGAMAHWSGSGPRGAVCGKCLEFGDIGDDDGTHIKRNRCHKYHQLMGKIGEAILPNTPACKYFESATKESGA